MGWRPAKSITALVGSLDDLFPHRTKPDWIRGDLSHSRRRSDHNADQWGVVRAVDIREGGGFHPGWLWDRLLDGRDERISYVIYNGLWFRSYRYGSYKPWTVITYRGRNPHRTHLHLSVGGRDVYDDTSDWELDVRRYVDEGKGTHTCKRVQQGLRKLGYDCRVTGLWDTQTAKAVGLFNLSFPELHDDGDRLSEEGLARLALRVGLR